MSFRPVENAGKLDGFSDGTWTVLTVLGGLAMFFALCGVITVGCAGLGVGSYLKSGRTTLIYSTYDDVQDIAVGGSTTIPRNVPDINYHVRWLTMQLFT